MRPASISMFVAASTSLIAAMAPAASMAPRTIAPASSVGRNAPDEAGSVRERKAMLAMIDALDIPFDSFTLPNGMRVVVHSDHRVPVVSMQLTYFVGAKDEQPGRSGFAHLFEHLMFTGSKNVPGDFIQPLLAVGAGLNGSTSYTDTNYFTVVPTPALDRALFMEADRMGHLREALTQAKLDLQRGVVTNENLQRANGSDAVVEDRVREALYPRGHPYRRPVGGSLKDLNAATLDDVVAFHRRYYVPNNAVLVLAGDVDVENAKELVTRYFAGIPAGRPVERMPVTAAPLTRATHETVTGPVTKSSVAMVWPTPAFASADTSALELAASLMTMAPGSSVVRALVDERKLFTDISARNNAFKDVGVFRVEGNVRPGVEPRVAAAAMRQEVARFLARPLSADRLYRLQSRTSYDAVLGYESAVDRGSALAGALLGYGDPAMYKQHLRTGAQQTPRTVLAAARRWLSRPGHEIILVPGARMISQEDAGPAVPQARPAPAPAEQKGSGATPLMSGQPAALPAVAAPPDGRFPTIDHATLGNGIPVDYVEDATIPYTMLAIDIEGGRLHQSPREAGTMEVMYEALAKGYDAYREEQLASRAGRLGITVETFASEFTGGVLVMAPDANLAVALAQSRDMLMRPAFAASTIDRLKRRRIDAAAASHIDPGDLTEDLFASLVDAGSPYNRLDAGEDVALLERIDRAGVIGSFHRWVRPEHARVRIVSATPLSKLMPMLDATIGAWRAGGKPMTVPTVTYTPRPGRPQIVLIDLPQALQAKVVAGQAIKATPGDPVEALRLATSVFSAGFSSRINTNLREVKGWTYGVSGDVDVRPAGSRYRLSGEFQQDKVGLAIAEMLGEARDIRNHRPITTEEFEQARRAILGALASSNSSRLSVLKTMGDISRNNWADDYPAHLSSRYRALTPDSVNAALRSVLDPDRWVWVVAGNAASIRPQLDKLGLPVRVLQLSDIAPASRGSSGKAL